MAAPTLLLVDAYALLYRAFHALPPLRNALGEPTGAVYGFIKTLRKYIADYQPTHWAIVFDLGAPAARLRQLPTYKAQRPPTPKDLENQLPLLRDWLAASRIPIVEREGEEADDLIATLADHAAARGVCCLIASGDKDFAQLVTDQVRLLKPIAKGKPEEAALMDADAVRARYGVAPQQMADYLALLGDASDNIPGVAGVGPKTASALLQKFGSLENLLRNLPKIENPALRDKLGAHADLLRRNQTLVTLRRDLPLDISLDALKLAPPDYSRLLPVLQRLGSKSLLAEAQKSSQSMQPILL